MIRSIVLIFFQWSIFIIQLTTDARVAAQSIEIERKLSLHELYFRVKQGSDIEQVKQELRFIGQLIEFKANLAFPSHQHYLELARIYELQTNDTQEIAFLLNSLKKCKSIEYVEYKPAYHTLYNPNDLLANQWSLKKIGANSAWSNGRGNSAISIGIVDDFFDRQHPEISNIISVNIGEVPSNGIDDDMNGYVDDYYGWHVGYDKPEILPPVANMASFAHGTHNAGIAGAQTDNGIGIASIGFGTSIIAVATGDSTKPGVLINPLKGVVYAADRGARIISISWGSYTYSITGQLVMDYVYKKGITVFAAAGNDNVEFPLYPAAYNYVISVASTDSVDKKSPFSNFGKWVDISAPGSSIWSCIPGAPGNYGYMSGTSMSTSLAAGLAALLLSQDPALSPMDIENLLKKASVDISSINPQYHAKLGEGRIDANRAILSLKKMKADFIVDKKSICPGQNIQFNFDGYGNGLSYSWSFQGGFPSSSNAKDPLVSYNSQGEFDVQLIVTNGLISDTLIQLELIEVYKPTATLGWNNNISIGEGSLLQIDLKGVAPWNIDLIGNGKRESILTHKTPFHHLVKPDTTTRYTIYKLQDARCHGDSSGSVRIAVSNVPNLGSEMCNKLPGGKSIGDLFTFSYGTTSNDFATGLLVLNDSNYLVYGYTRGIGSGAEDFFITKIDRSGKEKWTRTLGNNSYEGGLPIQCIETRNGDIILVGASTSGTSRWRSTVVRLSSAGNTIWSRVFPIKSAHDHLRGVTELADGSIAIAGTSGDPTDQSAAILRISENGTMLWRIGHDVANVADHYISVIQLGSYLYFLGHASRGNGGGSSSLTKTNMDGTIVWEYNYDLQQADVFLTFKELADKSGFVIGGYTFASSAVTNMEGLLTLIDTNGVVGWTKTFGGAGTDRIVSITRGADGYFYAAGYTTSVESVSKILVLKIDHQGNLLWNRIYGQFNLYHATPDFGNVITSDIDGGLLISGLHNSSDLNIYLFKINYCGESLCRSIKANFTLSSITYSRRNTGSTIKNLDAPTNWTFTNQTYTKAFQAETLCMENKVTACKLNAGLHYTAFCPGDSVELVNTSIDSTGRPLTHVVWELPEGVTLTGINKFKHLFQNSGAFPVKIKVWSDKFYQCSDSFMDTVYVDNKLKLRTASTRAICPGDSVTLIAKAFCGAPPYRYQWKNISTSPSLKDSSILTAPSSTTWHIVTVYDSQNNQASDSVRVVVRDNCCKYNSRITTDKKELCIGDSIHWKTNSINSFTAGYKWHFTSPMGSDSSFDQSGKSFKAKIPGKHSARLIVSGSACFADTAFSEVFILPAPLADAGIDSFLCSPDSINIGRGEPLPFHSYQWTPATGISNPSSLISNAYVTHDTKFNLRVTDLRTGCVASDTVNIDLYKKHTFHLDTIICEGSSIELFNPYPGKRQWNTMSVDNPLKIFTAGRFWLTDTTKLRCTGSDTIVVRISPSPYFQIAGDSLLCPGKSSYLYPNIDTTNLKGKWHDNVQLFKRQLFSTGKKWLTISNNGCNYTDSINVSLGNKPYLNMPKDSTVCANRSYFVRIETDASEIRWNDGPIGPTRMINMPGRYYVIVSNLCGTIQDSFTLYHKSIEIPYFPVPNDTTICHNESLQVTFPPNREIAYSWRDGYSGNSRKLDKSGEYVITASNECAIYSDSFKLQVEYCGCLLTVPNAITPQLDGLNDGFQAFFNCEPKDFNLRIYNRWGQKLVETNDPYLIWDGVYMDKPCQEGVYAYIITCKLPEGNSYYRKTLSGSFHLIR